MDRREGEDEESPRPPVSKTAAESPQEETLSSSPKYREVVPAQRSSQDREPAPCGEEVSSSGEDALPPRGGGAPASVLRMGVDLPLSPQDGVLWFQCQRIAAIENLDKVNGLKGLHIVSGEVRSLEGLECQSETLEELEIYQNQLKKIDLVSTLKNLRTLDLSFNKISRIENLESLVHLESLFLSSNKIAKIEGLSTLVNLKELELGCNKIREVEGLDTLTKLESLWLGKNKITKMSVPKLPRLQVLSFQSNRLCVWDASLFSHCPELRELHLSHNALPSPPPEMRQLKALKLLDIGNNKVANLDALAEGLEQLGDLWANDNLLEKVADVLCLKALPSLHTLYLERNPLQRNLGPAYRQTLLAEFPRLIQLDASFIPGVKTHQEGGEGVRSIMKH